MRRRPNRDGRTGTAEDMAGSRGGPSITASGQAGSPGGPNVTASVVLGHGASGNAASMAPWVAGLERHGFRARAIDLPHGAAERAIPVFAAEITAELAATGTVVAGGHSFGGRVATLAAAGLLDERRGPAGLLLLSYPLHRPGHPETWRERAAHWPRLRCPVLLLSGESDPFARLDLLREAVAILPDGKLVTYPRVGHGLAPVLDDALERAADFLRSLHGPGPDPLIGGGR